jgi:hypothetical protein
LEIHIELNYPNLLQRFAIVQHLLFEFSHSISKFLEINSENNVFCFNRNKNSSKNILNEKKQYLIKKIIQYFNDRTKSDEEVLIYEILNETSLLRTYNDIESLFFEAKLEFVKL